MDIGILHAHITVVTLFLISFLFKTILLVLDKVVLLKKIRDKTRIVDVILGPLLLMTGGYLIWIKGTIANYLLIKIILVLIAMPMGIIAMRKESKVLAFLALFVLIYVYGVAETKSLKFKRDKIVLPAYDSVAEAILESNLTKQLAYGKAIYQTLCVECHGEDGRKGLYRSPNPFQSQRAYEEKVAIILNGKGVMRGFELTEADIAALLAYLDCRKDSNL